MDVSLPVSGGNYAFVYSRTREEKAAGKRGGKHKSLRQSWLQEVWKKQTLIQIHKLPKAKQSERDLQL